MSHWPPIGSRWRERVPYRDRIVTVVGYDEATGKIILTSNQSQLRTKARPDRFGGGKSGYTYLDGPSEEDR